MKTPTRTPKIAAKRGRPEMSPARRQEMEGRISQAAKMLFKEKGYATVSLRRIAKEIGCTPMTIYGYYDSKIDILRTLWGDVFKDLFEVLQGIDKHSTAQNHLQDLCTAYAHYWIDNPDYYRLVFMAEGVTQPEVSLFIDSPDIVIHYGIFTQAIQNMTKETNIDQAKIKLDFLISVMHGIAHNHITMSGYDWTPPEQQIHFAVAGIG